MLLLPESISPFNEVLCGFPFYPWSCVRDSFGIYPSVCVINLDAIMRGISNINGWVCAFVFSIYIITSWYLPFFLSQILVLDFRHAHRMPFS
ncbi:hypothetical protein CR513_52741, partial [Mucuna pruriens]